MMAEAAAAKQAGLAKGAAGAGGSDEDDLPEIVKLVPTEKHKPLHEVDEATRKDEVHKRLNINH